MSTSPIAALSFASLGITNRDINTAPGVELNEKQKVIVGSVLDLFGGKPTLKKLALWTDDATFNDPLTSSRGRKKYAAQWYGLAAAFSSITQLSHSVTSAGNPINLNLETRYKVKGIGMEKVIQSQVVVETVGGDEGGDDIRIVRVEDRWGGWIPEGWFASAFRNLNAVVVPIFVSVPKNEEDDAKRGL